MRKTKEVDVPATKRTIVECLVCDICKAQSYESDGWGERYDVDEITIEREKGSSFPDGSWGEKTRIDLCPRCFEDKFLPWIKEQDAEPTVEEYDY